MKWKWCYLYRISKSLIVVVVSKARDASDYVVLDHVLEPSSIGVRPADQIQDGRPEQYPREYAKSHL